VVQSNQVKDIETYVLGLGQSARAAAKALSVATTEQKNNALTSIASAIESASEELLAANRLDMTLAQEKGINAALLDRLELTPARIHSMSEGCRNVAAQDDPIGALSESRRQPSGLEISRMRVPLRGGSEAEKSNMAIAKCVQSGLAAADLPMAAVQLIETTDRAAVGALLAMEDYVDVIIPRGGKGLVKRISEDAKVPVIKHLDGICHTYIDAGADSTKAIEVALNAKTYRYGICGSMETLLIHEAEAVHMLPLLNDAFTEKGVELRGCQNCLAIIPEMNLATDADWGTEYLAPVLSIRIVDDMDQAIDHIARHGSSHTDAIVTSDLARSKRFVREVDSSSVMVNAATCFADGAEYGLGAEIGISTNRMHVRGPVGTVGLTTEKYVVIGDYTTRG